MKNKVSSNINIQVEMDEHKIPAKINWSSSDNPHQIDQPAKAMLLSFFDAKSRDTLKIDLWVKEMQVIEMDRFMFQVLRSLADTYFSATNNQKLAGAMKNFAEYFGQETEILPKSKPS